MRIIVQKDDLGCGVACVAMVMNISYSNARSLFIDGDIKAQKTGFVCKEIVAALSKAGLDYEYKYIKPKLIDKLTLPMSIIFIKKSKLFPHGHYVVRTDNGWIDPWIYTSPDGKVAGIRKELPETPIYIITPKGNV